MYIMAYIGTTYLMLWINSFTEAGQIEDKKAAELVYSTLSMVGVPFQVITIALAGLLSDYI